MFRKIHAWFALCGVAFLALASSASAQDAPAFTADIAQQIADQRIAIDTIWVLVTGFLVFFMNLGFALVESGLF